ncbi:hypothetical protein FJW04_23820 [Mesorhizobium sp. B2-7-3]|nr:hypothetical protein FJW04_23820 [Mesorhizobium sp. B2-7-3]TPL67569.1 hypothetical protein FJ954_24920 [Mesorhizobium sp. B2-3-15]
MPESTATDSYTTFGTRSSQRASAGLIVTEATQMSPMEKGSRSRAQSPSSLRFFPLPAKQLLGANPVTWVSNPH